MEKRRHGLQRFSVAKSDKAKTDNHIINPNADADNTGDGDTERSKPRGSARSDSGGRNISTNNADNPDGADSSAGVGVAQVAHIDKLAYAIAMAETKNCELGYGEMYNNCFGIKNGSIAPCKAIGKNRMCIYDSPEESYAAFKAIWVKGYGGGFPTRRMAAIWTGNDRPDNWLRNVNHYYYNP